MDAGKDDNATGGDSGLQSQDRRIQNDVFWPKDLLPAIVPAARVFTFGFDADVLGFFSSASQNTIHQHAQTLLSDLADTRDELEESTVPLIFVVHSLGGIIVKDALNLSSTTVGTRLREIAPATYGICFLGTPHRGSETASLGKIAYSITIVATQRPNLQLLRSLRRNSEILSRIGDDFTQTLLKYPIKIHSFREELETRKLGIFNAMVDSFPVLSKASCSDNVGCRYRFCQNWTRE